MARGGAQIIPRPSGWQPGKPNPWMGQITAETFEFGRVQEILSAHIVDAPGAYGPDTVGAGTRTRDVVNGEAVNGEAANGEAANGVDFMAVQTPMRPPFITPSRLSAVLIPLFDDDGDTRVVLTRRSARLRTHSHQVAFPGGRLDEGETTADAALREAHEEIGLDPQSVKLIGQLEDLTTVVSDSRITPLIGLVGLDAGKLPELEPSPLEVERIFHVSLAELAHPDCYHEELWEFSDGLFPVWFFDVEDDTIWGATARMLRRMLDLVVFAKTS